MTRNFEAAAAELRERMARARRRCQYLRCDRWFVARRDMARVLQRPLLVERDSRRHPLHAADADRMPTAIQPRRAAPWFNSSMTNRRAFLAAILGAPAALVLDPERLLWRPGAKLISVPAPRVVPSFELTYPRGPFRGDTIIVRRPPRFDAYLAEYVYGPDGSLIFTSAARRGLMWG